MTALAAGGGNWRELYRTALFELDEQRLPSRIAEAERALLLRERELFSTASEDVEEQQAVNDALYALKALRNCMKLMTRKAPAA